MTIPKKVSSQWSAEAEPAAALGHCPHIEKQPDGPIMRPTLLLIRTGLTIAAIGIGTVLAISASEGPRHAAVQVGVSEPG